MKKKFANKRLLSVILSIMLLAEPAFSATVYAAEPDQAPVIELTTDAPAEDAAAEAPSDAQEAPAENPDEAVNAPGSEETLPADGTADSPEETLPGENTEAPSEASDESTEAPGSEETLPADDASDSPEEALTDETDSSEEALEEAQDPLADPAEKTAEELASGSKLLEDEAFINFANSYALSADQLAEKSDAQSMIEDFSKAEEGTDYVANEVFYFAETEEEAKEIAAAFHGELIVFQEGVATIRLSEFSVEDAVYTSMSADTNVPMVYPNYYRYITGETDEISENAQIILDNDEVIVWEESLDYSDEETAPSIEMISVNDLSGAQTHSENAGEDIDIKRFHYDDPLLTADSIGFQWHHSVVGSSDAWYAGYTGAGIKVVVIDTGVNAAHEDLNIKGAETVLTASGGDGSDWNGHGTAVCGTIGAMLNNGLGGAGVAPGVELYSIQAGSKEGSFKDADLLAALNKAISLNADVINMSLGGYGGNTAYLSAINSAYEKGIILVVSAGNENTNSFSYPASFDHVISVAATNEANQRASFSTYGSAVDLSAPGVDICTTSKDGGYIFEDGTSFSSPIVAGQAALVLEAAKDLGLDPAKSKARVDSVESLLKKSAFSCGSGMGSGIVFLPKALNTAAAGVTPNAPEMKVVSGTSGYTVTITVQKGASIYYNEYNSKPTFNSNNTRGKNPENTLTLSAPAERYNGTYVVQAFAANTTGEASKVKKISIKVKKTTSSKIEKKPATSIEIYTESYYDNQVAVGKSLRCWATVYPYPNASQKVTWSVVDSMAGTKDVTADMAKKGFKISSAGKISTTKSVTPGTYYICATSKETPSVKGVKAISVISTEIKSLSLRGADGKACKSATIFRTSGDYGAPTSASFYAEINGSGTFSRYQFDYSQSKYGLVYVSLGTPTGNKLPITVTSYGITTGSTKITIRTIDGSNKKTSFTVKVVNPASSLMITAPTTNSGVYVDSSHTNCAIVMQGKSLKLSAQIGNGFGKVSSKKVKWTVNNTSAASISKSGKLSAKKNSGGTLITVTAEMDDGSGVKATRYVIINGNPIAKLVCGGLKSGAKYNRHILYGLFKPGQGYGYTLSVANKYGEPCPCTGYQVTSSNPKVATAYRDGSQLVVLFNAKGKSKITVKALDGGKGKTFSFTVIVSGE